MIRGVISRPFALPVEHALEVGRNCPGRLHHFVQTGVNGIPLSPQLLLMREPLFNPAADFLAASEERTRLSLGLRPQPFGVLLGRSTPLLGVGIRLVADALGLLAALRMDACRLRASVVKHLVCAFETIPENVGNPLPELCVAKGTPVRAMREASVWRSPPPCLPPYARDHGESCGRDCKQYRQPTRKRVLTGCQLN
jgi:hypothetical protein